MEKKRLFSKNPDLLLPECMERQVKDVIEHHVWGEGPFRLHRLTVFVTHKCNLKCEYCTGPHLPQRVVVEDELREHRKREMLRSDLTLAAFHEYLSAIHNHCQEILHVHFTGGEATVNRSLPDMVSLASDKGALTSITSNGVAGPELYRTLIERGLTEVRISLDSSNAEVFDALVGVRGAFRRVVNTIQDIVRLRDQEGRDVFLVLNACVGATNLDHIEDTLRFLLSLSPNDVKFLVIVQDKAFMRDHASWELVGRLRELLRDRPTNSYYLLRRKIDNLFATDASGLMDEEAQQLMEHCYIPMTERTIDGKYYYPCSVYARQYGKPLGLITEPFDAQQKTSMDFVRTHDCRQDTICKNYCVNCCKIYNIALNLAMKADAMSIKTGEVLTVADSIEENEVAKELERWEHLTAVRLSRTKPFLIIKPQARKHRGEVIAILNRKGLKVESSGLIEDWRRFATMLYCREPTKEAIRRAIVTSRAFAQIEQGPAELLWFHDDISSDALLKLKYELRIALPNRCYTLALPGGHRRTIRLTAVHTPDYVNIERENALIGHSFVERRSSEIAGHHHSKH